MINDGTIFLHHFAAPGSAHAVCGVHGPRVHVTGHALLVECRRCYATPAWRAAAREVVLVECAVCNLKYRAREWLARPLVKLFGGASGIEYEERRCRCGVALGVKRVDAELLQEEVPA